MNRKVVAALLGTLLALSACGSDDNASSGEEFPSSQSEVTTTNPEESNSATRTPDPESETSSASHYENWQNRDLGTVSENDAVCDEFMWGTTGNYDDGLTPRASDIMSELRVDSTNGLQPMQELNSEIHDLIERADGDLQVALIQYQEPFLDYEEQIQAGATSLRVDLMELLENSNVIMEICIALDLAN